MRAFIEHLQKKTVPHDMLEEFRKAGVKFYDGWLIVKVVDHKSVAKAAATTGVEAEDKKPFSIHNYNTFITPSPYVPYPKQQTTNKSPVMKQEPGVAPDKYTNGDHPSSSTLGEPGSDDAARPSSKPGKPQPRIFHVALRPTNLSKHMDMVLASMELDPKSSLNRKQSQVFNARTPGSAGTMAAPLSLDTSAAGDKGPALKKRKLRIAPDQMIHFERAVTNHTAPPLCLNLVNSLEEAEVQMLMLRDPMYDQLPPSPKSRKRTVAELAADDALAKEQERFMLIMAGDGSGAGANAGVVDGQAAGAMFQPDFGKFNTIQQIKFQTAEKNKRDEERRMHDDANKRLQEEERKRHQEVMRLQQQQAQQQLADRNRHLQLAEQKRIAVQAAAAQQQQQQLQMQQQMQAQQQAQQNAQQMAHLSGVPPNMQNQMRQGQPMSSPVMRQSTPHGNSSPILNNGQAQAVPMASQGSQQGMAGSPARPGSAMQHGHPGVAMARGPSNQGPSRNGTPQIPQNTPAMRQATPVMRQGTPSQRMSHASPHPGMTAATPQMQQAPMMAPGQQMPNGMHYAQNSQHAMQQRNLAMQQAAMQQNMIATNPQMAQAQMAHMQAQRHANANADQQAAFLQHRQRQVAAAAHQAQLQQTQQQQQAGTPQPTAPSPAQHAQNQYSQNLRNQLQNQMQQVGNHGSPAPQSQPTPQQQMAHLQRQQQAAAQAGQMNPQMAQPGMQMSPQQQMMRNAQMQQMQQAQQAQYSQMNPQQQQQMQQMMMQQQAARAQMTPQQLVAMQQQQAQAQHAQAQQRPAYPPQIQANMAKIRDQRIAHHTTKVANDRYGGNVQMIQPNEQQDIKRLAMMDAQTWARKWQANNAAQAGQRAAMMQAQQQQMGVGLQGGPQQQQ
jgi:transcription factor SPT20